MSFIQEKIKLTCSRLYALANRKLTEITDTEYVRAPGYKTDNVIPTEGWAPFPPGMRVREPDGHFWFRSHFCTPDTPEGTAYYIWLSPVTEGPGDAFNIPQSLIYLNGKMHQGCDRNHHQVFLEPNREYTLHNYFYMGLRDITAAPRMELFALDEKTEALYYDMQVALDCCMLQDPNADAYISVMDVLEQTANRIDFREPYSPAYAQSICTALAFIREALYNKLCTTEGKPVVNCIGHTHIDVEFRWTRDQSKEKIQRNFSTATVLMKKYPEYKFMLSNPELYRYLKEGAPEKYQELRQLVREGRWEPEGAMWVEADCNLPSGESFVRQIFQGKKFFRDEFGTECRILFLPDVFGYSSALPQILKKSGIRHFVTSKLGWNEENTMPVNCFLWQGLDGTEIFTNFYTNQQYDPTGKERRTSYNGLLTPAEIKGTWSNFKQKEYTREAFCTYGYGDGGGGPTREMLENQRRLAKGLPGMPVTRMNGLLPYLDRVREDFDKSCARIGRTPRWVGELYLECHRGTYTSQAKNKRNNRKSEFLLQMTEALSYQDLLSGGSYDGEGIYRNWNKVLHNQFHDIIPGSSIGPVYAYTDQDYEEVRTFCGHVIREKLRRLAENIKARQGILVYNSLGFPRTGTVQIGGRTGELRQCVPAMGWTVAGETVTETEVRINGLTAENRYYRMSLDEAGRIVSLFDKTASRQVLKNGCPGNELQIFEDYPWHHDNWEISEYYKDKMWVLDEKAQISPITDGSRAGFRITRTYMQSAFTQNIWLYTESRRIDFETRIDWHQHHQILKTAFPLDIHTSEATYEIQFGHVHRPTHENTSWDKAKFEVYGHKWVDLSENGYGVSMLNDCKYGYNTEGSTLKLTMLKCGTEPDPNADQGMHLFTYSLLPHQGDFREAGVIQEAYSLNQPLAAMEVSPQSGTLPEQFSLVSCDQPNVIVETVKKAEADAGMVVRMYEAWDKRTHARIQVPACFTEAWLCDLLENPLQNLEIRDGCVELPVSNFEIITLKFVK